MKRLKTEHLIAINILALPKRAGKTMEQVAEEAGVARSTLYEWLKEPLFEAELKRQMIRNTRDKLPELLESLTDIAIRDGNAAMAKLALQINGMLTDKVEIEQTTRTDGIDRDELRAKLERLSASKKNEGKDVE